LNDLSLPACQGKLWHRHVDPIGRRVCSSPVCYDLLLLVLPPSPRLASISHARLGIVKRGLASGGFSSICWVAPFPQLQPLLICPPVCCSHGALLLPAAPPPTPPHPWLPRLRAGLGAGRPAQVLEAQQLPGQLGACDGTP
jgi:hypothetical protein